VCPILIHGSSVSLPKFQKAPKCIFLISSGTKKEELRYTCLSEAKASHSQRILAEVSSSAPHLLHNGLSDSPIKQICLLRVLCPVRRPIITLDYVLLKDKNLAMAPRQGPKISCQACLWVLSRPRHHTQCWLTNQWLNHLLVTCLGTPKAGSGPTNLEAEMPLAIPSATSLPLTPARPGTQYKPTTSWFTYHNFQTWYASISSCTKHLWSKI
jgi:hypothetical protein